jgi:Family of unknown function (DUF5335)
MLKRVCAMPNWAWNAIGFTSCARDPKDDVVEVAFEGLDHMIPRPREIYAQEGAAGLASLEVVDSIGAKQIVKFRNQLLLPSSRWFRRTKTGRGGYLAGQAV